MLVHISIDISQSAVDILLNALVREAINIVYTI